MFNENNQKFLDLIKLRKYRYKIIIAKEASHQKVDLLFFTCVSHDIYQAVENPVTVSYR